MLEFLGELGIVFILLALFGFIIKDAFQFGLTLKPPSLYKTYILSLFHYVSIALYVLSFSTALFIMILASPNQENMITSFFNSILRPI